MAKVAEASVVLRPRSRFNGVQVISATVFAERQMLGDRVTSWIAGHPECSLVEIAVTQSSDCSYHCLTFTIFYLE